MTMDGDMPEKDPLTYDLLTYAWVFSLSVWGGIAGYIRKMKTGVVIRFSLTEIVGDVVVSGFVGVVTFFICESSGVPKLLSAAFIGISAHMGSRAIFVLENAADRVFQRWVGKNGNG